MNTSNNRNEDRFMDTNTASTTTGGGMQSTNYPNHQHGANRNTLKKPSPNANQTDNVGLGTTGGASGYPVDNTTNNAYSSTTTPGTFPSSSSPTTGAVNPPTAATATSPTYPDIKLAKKEERKGKIETTVGNVLHSSSLKAKGAVHLETAAALNTQHSSLQEAEALEREAKVHRDRAEAHKMAAEAMTGGVEQGAGRYDGINNGRGTQA